MVAKQIGIGWSYLADFSLEKILVTHSTNSLNLIPAKLQAIAIHMSAGLT